MRVLAAAALLGSAVASEWGPDPAAHPSAPSPHIGHNETIPSYLAKYGIETEEHSVTTDDGYILGLFRLPRAGAPVVFLQHGLLDSSWSWLYNSPEYALGFQLHNLGYDVWMGNNRGNMFSEKHTSMKPTLNKEFWSFSFADMGRHDVPAQIDYVLQSTSKDTLSYVGHSQGTSQMFTALTQPNMTTFLESKVNLFVALAPVAYMKHQNVELYKVVGRLHLGAMMEKMWPYGFLASDQVSSFGSIMCKLTGGAICKFGVNIAVGTSEEDSADAILNITSHFPSGTSVQATNHYEQLYLQGKFQDYDWGKKVNQQRYGTKTPPVFDLSQAAKVPTALFIGSKDELGDPTDAARLEKELPAGNVVYSKMFQDFSHITWIAGKSDAWQQWYPEAKSLLEKFNPLPATDVVV